MKFIPYSCQSIDQDDIDAVVDVLKSDFLTTGPMIPAFEQAVSEYCGVKYASAVSNATAALHIACLSLGVGPDDTVWTSPNTFLSSANCALYCGAKVDFVDIDPDTLNMSEELLEEKLKEAKMSNTLPEIVIPVHFAGRSCNMKKIHVLSQEYGFKIIEDASHALGSEYNGQKVGSCEFSDITVFSFHAVKMITSGEGGMCMTNSPELKSQLDLYRCHGMTRDPKLMVEQPEGPWVYEQSVLGYNYRITDFQCALGISQLKRLDEFVAVRNKLANGYRNGLASLPLILPKASHDLMSYHLFVIELKDDFLPQRLELFKKLREAQLGVNVHYEPVYVQPYYRKLGFEKGLCPNAEKYYSRCISIPLHQKIPHEDQMRIISSLEKICKEFVGQRRVNG